MMTRRHALKTAALAGAALATLPDALATSPAPFTLPPLPYAGDALEPHLDARTLEIHHARHHAAYVANLNKAFGQMDWSGAAPTVATLEHWLKDAEFLSKNSAIRNNGGGHYNHSLFWQMMKKDGGGEPTGELSAAIDRSFGSFSTFKASLTQAALGQFGSGWAWLVLDGRQLKIEPTANQDTPLSAGRMPLLGVDVWEHAYYLKYQNQRANYIAAWWNVVNWDFVSERHAKATA